MEKRNEKRRNSHRIQFLGKSKNYENDMNLKQIHLRMQKKKDNFSL